MHPLHPRTSETYNTGSKTNHHGGKTTALQKEQEGSDGPLPETFAQ